MNLTVTQLVNLSSSALIIILGLFVLSRDRKSRLYVTYFLYSFFIAWYLFCVYMLSMVADAAAALVWVKVLNIGGLLLVYTFPHFVYQFIEKKYPRPVFIATSVLSGLFILSVFTPWYIGGVSKLTFGYFAVPSYFLFAAAPYALLVMVFSHVVLLLNYRRSSALKRLQIKYIFAATIIFILSFFVGVLNVFSITVLEGFPLSNIAAIIYAGLLAYAIIRHHLMDIDVVIRYTTVYGLLIGFIAFVYVGTIFFFEKIASAHLGIESEWTARIAASVIIAVCFLPVRNFLEGIIERLFFGSKYNYVRLLRDFSSDLTNIIELRQILESVAKTMHDVLEVQTVAVYVFNKEQSRFEAKAFFGVSNNVREMPVPADDPLVAWLHDNKRVLYPQFAAPSDRALVDGIGRRYAMLGAALYVPLLFNNKLMGFMTLSERRRSFLYTHNDLFLLQTIGDAIAIAMSNAFAYEDLKKMYFGTIEAFAAAIELKDKYTWGHSERVMGIARQLAIELSMTRDEIDALQYAAVLHDIGKITIENAVLNKQGRLTETEYQQVKLHPSVGETIIESIEFLAPARTIIRHHHERWDGSGYPDGLRGDDIPVLARILSVADAFEAITAARPYQEKRSIDDGLAEVRKYAGSQFDPRIVDVLVVLHENGKLASI